MKAHRLLAYIIYISLGILGACENYIPSEPIQTPDPCAKENIPKESMKIKNLMDEFDDVNFVANLTPQAQLADRVIELQAIRRKVEQADTPACIYSLKKSSVDYMNSVIGYLAHFMAGGTRETINQEIAQSQSLRSNYENELAKVVGLGYKPKETLTPFPLLAVSATTNPTTLIPVTSDAEKSPMATNNSTISVNIRINPDLESPISGYLMPQESIPAIGRTSDSKWIAVLLEIDDQPVIGWVYTNLVILDVDIELLPTPEPTSTP